MDNLSAHKKALRLPPYKLQRRVKVYWLPTNSSWLNLIESYFAALQKTGLDNTNYKSPEEIDHGLQKGVQYLNLTPKPYVWKKIYHYLCVTTLAIKKLPNRQANPRQQKGSDL